MASFTYLVNVIRKEGVSSDDLECRIAKVLFFLFFFLKKKKISLRKRIRILEATLMKGSLVDLDQGPGRFFTLGVCFCFLRK